VGTGNFQETEEWLKKSELGVYAPGSYDESSMKAKARRRCPSLLLVRTSTTSGRAEKQFPGIKVNGFDMDSTEIVTKVLAESRGWNFTADVIFLKDPPQSIMNSSKRAGLHVRSAGYQASPSRALQKPFSSTMSVSIPWFTTPR
jgi:hypothetical protein